MLNVLSLRSGNAFFKVFTTSREEVKMIPSNFFPPYAIFDHKCTVQLNRRRVCPILHDGPLHCSSVNIVKVPIIDCILFCLLELFDNLFLAKCVHQVYIKVQYYGYEKIYNCNNYGHSALLWAKKKILFPGPLNVIRKIPCNTFKPNLWTARTTHENLTLECYKWKWRV